jgi:hypothetical protein
MTWESSKAVVRAEVRSHTPPIVPWRGAADHDNQGHSPPSSQRDSTAAMRTTGTASQDLRGGNGSPANLSLTLPRHNDGPVPHRTGTRSNGVGFAHPACTRTLSLLFSACYLLSQKYPKFLIRHDNSQPRQISHLFLLETSLFREKARSAMGRETSMNFPYRAGVGSCPSQISAPLSLLTRHAMKATKFNRCLPCSRAATLARMGPTGPVLAQTTLVAASP